MVALIHPGFDVNGDDTSLQTFQRDYWFVAAFTVIAGAILAVLMTMIVRKHLFTWTWNTINGMCHYITNRMVHYKAKFNKTTEDQDQGITLQDQDQGITLQDDIDSHEIHQSEDLQSEIIPADKTKDDAHSLPLHQSVRTNIIFSRFGEAMCNGLSWDSRCTWALYVDGHPTSVPFVLMSEAYSMFGSVSPAHLGVTRSTSRFEEEVIAMTAALFCPNNELLRNVRGNLTSGLTESVMLTARASWFYLEHKRGTVIKKPEMIVPDSATNDIYEQVAEYLNIRLFRVHVDSEYKADVGSIRRLISQNTILIVGSAPSFSYGIIDPIKELAALASRFGICFHVDVSVGGILLPFWDKKLGDQSKNSIDFSIEGVTSMSIDLDTDGLAPKGTSLILYRNPEIRKHQFVVTEWSGGRYDSPTIIGCKNVGLAAGAWASMQSLGEDGYESYRQMIFDAATHIRKGIEEIPGLFLIGKPNMTIIVFATVVGSVDIEELHRQLREKLCYVRLLKKPKSIRIHVTRAHCEGGVDVFLGHLKDSIKESKIPRKMPWYNPRRYTKLWSLTSERAAAGTIHGDLVRVNLGSYLFAG